MISPKILGPVSSLCVLYCLAILSGPARAQDCAQIKAQMIGIENSMAEAQQQLTSCENHVGICSPGTIAGWQETIKLDGEELTADRQKLITGCAPPPPPSRHVQLDGIEITQAIENMSQSITLVAGKQTWARVYFSTTSNLPITIKATLRAKNSATNGTEDIPSIASVVLTPGTSLRARRESWNLSLNFPVPSTIAAAGAADFTVVAVSDVDSGSPVVCDQCINDRQVSFVATPPLRVRIIGMKYSSGTPPVSQTPRVVDFALLQSWLLRAYPSAQLTASTTTVNASNPWPFTCNQANTQLAAIRANDIANGADSRTHYLGLVFNGGGYMRGCASGAPATPDPTTVASAPTGSTSGANVPVNVTGDTDASFGDWYGGHELAHTYGRNHPGFCNGNSASDPNFPNPNGQISDNQGDDTGLDVGDTANGVQLAVLPGATKFDIMTYCNQPQWLSGYAYEGVRTRLAAEDPSGGGAPGGGAPVGSETPSAGSTAGPAEMLIGSFVHVVASVNVTKQTGKIEYVTPVAKAAPQAASDGRAELRTLTNTSEVLGHYAVQVREDTDIPTGEDQTAIIDAAIPFTPSLGQIQLVLSGKILDNFRASQNQPPRPTGLRLAHGAIAPTAEVAAGTVITWAPTLMPGDHVTYVVQTSQDGKTWDTIGVGLVQPTLALTAQQAASSFVRIIATNGFQNSEPVVLPMSRN